MLQCSRTVRCFLFMPLLSVISPAASLQHTTRAEREPPPAALDAASTCRALLEPAAGNASAGPPMLVVVMIMSVPEDFSWRAMVRASLPQLTSGVSLSARPVQVVVRFAVGRPHVSEDPGSRARTQALLERELDSFGDLALLNISDGKKRLHSTDQFQGKVWHLFAWALQHYPEADLVFKQDDDTLVNWRVALPLMLQSRGLAGSAGASGEAASSRLDRVYVGRHCPWHLCGPVMARFNLGPTDQCAAGHLYGLSRDVIRWILTRAKPVPGEEDILVCRWVHSFAFGGSSPLDSSGLLYPPCHDNAWIHPVKDRGLYSKCFQDHEHGCEVQFWKDPVNRFRLL